MLTALKHNLGQLLTFSGRTRPLHFWLYTAVVFLLVMAGSMVAVGSVTIDTFQRLNRFVREHPDQVTVTHYQGGTSWEVHGNHPELMPDFNVMIAVMGVLTLVAVLLLAAAVTRRLHDTNRRGWWGLLPLAFLAFGFVAFPMVMASIMAANGQEPDLTLFFLLLINNLAYLGFLVLLVVLLCLGGTKGENRFGPPPA